MKIGLLNTKNDKINASGGIRNDGTDNAKIIADHIMESDYDFLGTQELTYKISKRIQKYLKGYNIYGKYRLGNILRKVKINENNSIITKHKVLKQKTYHLPFLPHNFKDLKKSLKKHSIMPRIVQVLIIEVDEDLICIINTHIDYYVSEIQKRQLEKIYKIVKKYNQHYPVFLMGDFNLEVKNDLFKKFIDKLDDINIKRVSIDLKTNGLKYKNKTAIDHLFIPNNYQIKEFGILNDSNLKDVTDHTGLYAVISKDTF